MIVPEFGKLVDMKLRDAWPDEARDFTPWLADNIDHLSETLGIQLELTGTEVAVDAFSADILARDLSDESYVLIENQLETTDHKHLGQILTYLAGLDAKTVIWIAPSFRAAHLSAIRWLNENTADGFSFFAVKARVVRIGDSAFAPIFDAVEKPDGWQRTLAKKKESGNKSKDETSDLRLGFWQHYLNRHPEAAEVGLKLTRAWNSYFAMADGDVIVSVWIGENRGGIYVRGGWGDRKMAADELLSPFDSQISEAVGIPFSNADEKGHLFGERFALSYLDRSNWDEITDWMESKRVTYMDAIEVALAEGETE